MIQPWAVTPQPQKHAQYHFHLVDSALFRECRLLSVQKHHHPGFDVRDLVHVDLWVMLQCDQSKDSAFWPSRLHHRFKLTKALCHLTLDRSVRGAGLLCGFITSDVVLLRNVKEIIVGDHRGVLDITGPVFPIE